MGTPNDRRVIWGSHVVPQVSFSTTSTQVTREEGSTAGTASYTDYKLDTTIAKRFGGKGSVDIHSNQADDGWVSFFSPVDNTWDSRSESDDQWEDTYVVWDGALSIVNGSDTVLRSQDTVNIDFLYIKNTGSNEATLDIGGVGNDILIPAGAAVSMRVNDQTSANIKVDTTSGTTTIEYIIALTTS